MVDRDEDVRTRSIANSVECRVTVNSKYRKTSNTSWVSSMYNLGVVTIWCQLMTLLVVLTRIMTKPLNVW